MNTGTKIALAASGGYLLGRTKKAKLALAFGLFLAGRKLPKSPLELVQQGAGALSKNPQVAELTQQVKGSLFDAGKVAASRSAERWLSGVSDRLREGIPTPDVGGDNKQADQGEEADEDEGQDTDQETDQEDTDSDQDTDQGSTEDSEEEDSQDADEDSSESQNDNSSKSSGQRSSQSSGSSRPAKKSGSRSRAAKGA